MPFDHPSHNMPPPLVHIGYPKALSSWLQKFFFKPEHGFLNILDSLHTQISVIDPTPFRFDENTALQFIEQSLQQHPDHQGLVPICSAEALVGNPYCGGYNARQNADRLKVLFPDARILIIVREQASLMRSLYKTLVVWGMPHSISQLLNPRDTSLAPQFNLDYLRFDLLTDYYQQLFGSSNVLVLPYERFRQSPEAFTAAISHHAGCNRHGHGTPPWQKRINRNQSLAHLYLQRMANVFLHSPFNYAGPLASTEARMHKRIKRSKRDWLPAFTGEWFENDFRQTVRHKFKGEFEESNSRLSRLTGLNLAECGYQVCNNQQAEKGAL